MYVAKIPPETIMSPYIPIDSDIILLNFCVYLFFLVLSVFAGDLSGLDKEVQLIATPKETPLLKILARQNDQTEAHVLNFPIHFLLEPPGGAYLKCHTPKIMWAI